MKRSRLLLALAAVIAISIVIVALLADKSEKRQDGRVSVIATIFPVYDFVRAVGGDRVTVSMLMPPGTEAHSYEPKPSDIGKLNKAGLFVFMGDDMEPWASDLTAGLGPEGPKVLEAGQGVPVLLLESEEHSHGEGSVEGHGDGNGHDPHIWLDFTNASYIVGRIAEVLSDIDPEGTGYYSANAADYVAKLADLDAAFREAVEGSSTRVIVHGGHYAFGYLANRYGLEYVAAQGLSPDSEPGPKQLMQLMEVIKQTGAKYIFYEELVEPKMAKAISEETGIGMLLLHAGHNVSKQQFESGATFLDLMRGNLENLRIGLGYHGK